MAEFYFRLDIYVLCWSNTLKNNNLFPLSHALIMQNEPASE